MLKVHRRRGLQPHSTPSSVERLARIFRPRQDAMSRSLSCSNKMSILALRHYTFPGEKTTRQALLVHSLLCSDRHRRCLAGTPRPVLLRGSTEANRDRWYLQEAPKPEEIDKTLWMVRVKRDVTVNPELDASYWDRRAHRQCYCQATFQAASRA